VAGRLGGSLHLPLHIALSAAPTFSSGALATRSAWFGAWACRREEAGESTSCLHHAFSLGGHFYAHTTPFLPCHYTAPPHLSSSSGRGGPASFHSLFGRSVGQVSHHLYISLSSQCLPHLTCLTSNIISRMGHGVVLCVGGRVTGGRKGRKTRYEPVAYDGRHTLPPDTACQSPLKYDSGVWWQTGVPIMRRKRMAAHLPVCREV